MRINAGRVEDVYDKMERGRESFGLFIANTMLLLVLLGITLIGMDNWILVYLCAITCLEGVYFSRVWVSSRKYAVDISKCHIEATREGMRCIRIRNGALEALEVPWDEVKKITAGKGPRFRIHMRRSKKGSRKRFMVGSFGYEKGEFIAFVNRMSSAFNANVAFYGRIKRGRDKARRGEWQYVLFILAYFLPVFWSVFFILLR